MAGWQIVGEPREYNPSESGGALDSYRGWVYRIEREGESRDIRADVSGTADASDDVVRESRDAIRTLGRSAIVPLLDEDDPPERVMITTGGIRQA